MLCCRLCLTFRKKKKKEKENRHGKKWPYTPRFPLGRLAAGPTGAAQEEHLLRLSPPTSGLARSVRRRDAQLDWGVAFYASRRRRRAWPGGGNGGVRCWTGNCSLRLSPTSGQARRRWQDGEFAFYTSRRRLWAWLRGGGCGAPGAQLEIFLSTPRVADFGPGPGVGGGGARSWTESLPSTPLATDFGSHLEGAGGGARCLGQKFAFLSFTHLPLDARPSYAQSLVPTPSKTADQTLPPLTGWGRPAPLQCELNLLGSPCGADWVNKESTMAGSPLLCAGLPRLARPVPLALSLELA